MAETPTRHPAGRFTGIADVYAAGRPDYPVAAVEFIRTHCGLGSGSVLVDVGCGTGISSRQFAALGLRVIGIEPNDDMRRRAAEHPGSPAPEYRAGHAEVTGLPDGYADAVLSAQAFHWFDPTATLQEFARILKPGGWVALMWNERDPSDAFTAAYGAVVRASRDGAKVEDSRIRAGEPLLHSPLFEAGERVTFTHAQEVDEQGLLERALSTTYAPREGEALETYTQALREVFRRFQREGKASIRYETSVYVARKRETRA